MLRELFTLMRDRGSHVARRLGLDRESVSIAARHGRCRAAWAPHLDAAQQLILEAADACPGRGTAVILGSGLCLDVPVAALSERFATVLLVDAHQPRATRNMAKRFPNVRCVAADVTGMAQEAAQAAKTRTPLPRPIPLPDPLPGVRPDFTVSVNLASQLPIPFYKLLARHRDTAEFAAFCQGLIETHFRWLSGLSGRVCLLCDTAWQRVDGDRIIENRDALEGVVLPPPDRSWIWSIAPRPEESPAYDRQNLVWGYRDFASAWNASLKQV